MKKRIYRLDKEFVCEIMPHDFNTLIFLRQDIEFLTYLYPNINYWYWNTFAEGFARNEREVLFVRDKSGNFAGFSLLKRTPLEKKICTFFILPEFRESGVGKKMLPISIDIVGEKDACITVSELVNTSLEPLLLANSFSLEAKINSLYRPENTEFLYRLK